MQHEVIAKLSSGTTWYRVAGGLPAGKLPLLVLHGGSVSTHDCPDNSMVRARDGRLETWPLDLQRTIAAKTANPTVYSTTIRTSGCPVVGSLRDRTIVDRFDRISAPTLLVSGRHTDRSSDVQWTAFEQASQTLHRLERSELIRGSWKLSPSGYQARGTAKPESWLTRRDPGVPVPPGEIPWPYSLAELRADAAIHALGIALVTIGGISLATVLPRLHGAELAATAAYVAAQTTSSFASAAYNTWPVSAFKWRLRRFDHSAIYLLIAGTYTPVAVRAGTWRLLAFVWVMAMVGIVIKLAYPGRFDRMSIALYLALAWSGLFVLDKLIIGLPVSTLWLFGTGGIVYSLGVIFFIWESLRFQNAIWHALVLIASGFHYTAVWSMVGPIVIS